MLLPPFCIQHLYKLYSIWYNISNKNKAQLTNAVSSREVKNVIIREEGS